MLLMIADLVLPVIGSGEDMVAAYNQGYNDANALWHTKGSCAASTTDVLLMFVTVPAIIGCIYSFVCFFRFIMNVNRDKIFVIENVPLLRIAGWGYILGLVASMLMDVRMDVSFIESFCQHIDAIILCSFILIVAEVFTLGLKMQEDQDLTV